MSDFSDKVVLITGGSSGIGRAAAIRFARNGAAVVISARGRERGEAVLQELLATGSRATFVQADVSRSDQVQRLVEQTLEAFGRLDCAVNNAATVDGSLRATADFAEEDFDRAIGINLKSVWLCMKFEIAQMLAKGGAIVNTSSVNGLGGAPAGGLYSAAKAGVLALTKAAAQEYAGSGIRVNALVAGAFDTPMLNSVWDQASGGNEQARKDIEGFMTGLIPMRRVGRPEEAAEAIVWLCSEAASYVTGHSMIVDGGMTSPFR